MEFRSLWANYFLNMTLHIINEGKSIKLRAMCNHNPHNSVRFDFSCFLNGRGEEQAQFKSNFRGIRRVRRSVPRPKQD
ncbi:MAG: hypothetical protein VXX55_05110, partial [Planctomycetota bacterium]|nr:hypothetical protein [Planctomycetota bacterium]